MKNLISGKNMTINEKLYARMYTKTFLRKVHARYYQLPNEELSREISNYFKMIMANDSTF